MVWLLIQRWLFSLDMNSLFYLKLKAGGGVILKMEIICRTLQENLSDVWKCERPCHWFSALWHVWKIPAGFTDVTGITASTYKLINHTWTEPVRDRVFHTKQITDFKGRENQFDIQVIAIALNKMADPFLSDNREMAYVG